MGEPGADLEQVEREYQDAKARERSAVRAGREWDKRTGLAPMRSRYERTDRAARAAGMAMAKTRPTTPAGAGKLVDYVRRDIEGGETEWHLVALKTVAGALAEMGGGNA